MTIKSCIGRVNHSLGAMQITIINLTIKNSAREVKKVDRHKDNTVEGDKEIFIRVVCCE